MIVLDELFTLLEWLASQNTYVQHTIGGSGSANRFAKFKSEALTKQNSGLGSPRMEVCELPFGNIVDGGGWFRDKATFKIRVIYDSTKFKTETEVSGMDNAKKSLMELFNYIRIAKENCTDCNDLLCLFDLNSIKYQWLDKATLQGDYVGCEASFEFKKGINWDSINYGPLPAYFINPPEYPDNTTAVAALGVNRVYFTDYGGDHFLKITY
jgi:hypothetical protein